MKMLLIPSLIIICFLGSCSNQSIVENNQANNEKESTEHSVKKATESKIELKQKTEAKVVTREGRSVSNNHSGNINQGGKYIVYDDWLYFSNIFDNSYLYKVRLDGTDAKRLTDHPVSDLHIYEEWIYYFQLDNEDYYPIPQSINKVMIDGGQPAIVTNEIGENLYSFENMLLFITEDVIHKLTLGEDRLMELPYIALSMSVSSNGKIIYYNHDGYHVGDIDGQNWKRLFSENYGEFVIVNDDLYYTIMEGTSGLYRFSLDDEITDHVVTESVDYFNIDENSIYYSTGNPEADRSIYEVDLNGENKHNFNTVIYSINIFEDYVIGEFSRQGFGSISIIDRTTKEIKNVFSK